MTILINLLRLSCFLVWGLFFATQAVNGQNVSAQIGNYTSTSCQPGDTISIPVTIISAPGIGVSAISLAIEYDTTKLECLNHITGLNPVLSGPFIGNCGNFTNLGTSYNLTGKQFRVSWYQLNPVQLSGLAFNLSFRVLSPGSSSIQWDLQTPEVCGFYDELAEEISQVSYQNGSIQCNYNPYNLQTDLTHVGDCFSPVGDTLDVPVTLQNFNGLGITSISMAIDYDSTKLRCLPGIIALNPSLTSGFLSNSGWFNNLGPNANASGSQFRAVWYQISPVNLSGTLFKIRFITTVPGTHNIVFDNQTPGNCEYSDSNALVVPNTHWTNGSVTASLLPRSLFATDTLFLCGDSTTIGVTPGLGQYLWNTGDTTALCIVNRSGWYSCTVFSGQCALSDSVYVDLLSMRLVASADTLCAGSVLRLSASLTGPTLSGLFDGHRVYQASNPVPVGNQPRTYSIRFKTNQNLRQSFLSHGSLSTGPGLVDLGMNLNVGYGAASGHCASINSGPSFFSTAHANTWGQAILMNEWNTLTYVMGSGGSMAFSDTRVFLNGNRISHGSGAVPSCGHNWGGWNYQTEPSPLFIGSGLGANPPFGGSALFDGDFDYISIWNRALSDHEVLNAQNSNPWCISNGLQHLYTFSGLGDQSELIDEVSQNNAYLVRGSAANPLSTVRYQWSTGDTMASIRVNPTQTTTYTLSVTDSYRTCTDSFTVYVTPNTLPTSLFPHDSLFVCGDSVNLSVGTGYDSYRWNSGDTLSNLTAKRSGWFTCIATLGNCQVTDSLYVSLISDRIVQPTMPVCAGTTVTLQTIGNYSNSLRQGMIAHWPFNGQAGSTYGINRPNDYEQIGYTTDRFGLAGRAASFNGSNQYIQTNQPVLTAYGPYSISFWAQSNSGSDMEIFSQACPSDCQINGQFFHDFRVQLNAGQCQALGLSFKNESHFATANTITNDGLWHHYTMVVGSNSNHSYSNIEFYKDGQFMFVNCGHNWGGWQYMLPQVPTRIGAPVKGGTVPFQGNLDEITVWNRALNRSEINDMLHEQPTRYLWSTGDTTPNITVNPLQTTTYYVTISNGIHSCLDSVTVQVVPNSIPPNFLGNDSLFVCGNSILLNAGSGYSAYQWSNGQTTDTLRVRNSGWYKCIVTNGVCSSPDSVFVSLINADAQANDNLICQGNSTTLNVRGFPGALVNSNSHFSVRLSVNMSQYTGPIASNGMRIGGNLGALGGVIDGIPMSIWNPTSSECALDSLGNSLWSTEIEFPVSALGSTVLFKFVNGNWGNNEGTANNALVDYGCGLNDGSGNINRSITLERGLDLIYCYDSCTNCDGGAPNQSQMRTIWSTGDTTASITVTPTQSTNYYVTISNGIHSCVDSVTVRVSPKIFIPNMEVCQGDTINVPVIASRLDSVAAISLALNYNDQAMTYVGYTGLRSDMVSTSSIGTAPGQVRMAWFGLTPLISNSADTLVYYQFVVHQPGSFGWNIQVQGDCELADLNLNILDYCFEGGSLGLVDTVTILSSSQGPYIVEVGDSIHLNVQSSGAVNQRWQIWNVNLGQWDNIQDNGVYQGTSTPSLTYHCLTYQRPFPKFRLELSNGCRFWYGPEMPVSIKQRISVSLGSSVGCEGDTLEIPVVISGAREVGAVSLVFAFNANSLQLVDWINSAPQTVSNQWFVNQVGNEIRLAWFSLQSANIPDGQPLGVLKVVGLSSSGLAWDLVTAGNCEFGDEEASSIPASFVSGSLTIHPLPSVQLTASAQAICPNGGVSVLSTVADPSYTYQWYLNGQPLTGSTGDSHLAGQSGLYQVKVTNTNGCTRWSTIQTISDHPLPNPVVQAVGNTMTCEQPVLLNASATQGNSLEFWWYLNGIPLSSTPSTQWTATQSGDYSVKALDLGTLCENWSPTVAININPIPTSTISYTGLTTFCLGDSLTLLANTNLGTAFQWTTNGQPIPDATNPTFVARQQGTYAVVVSTALGCTSTSGSINVWVQNCNAINGRLSYNNTLRTPLRNTKILFQDSAGSILDSTTTNNAGDYSFSGYSNGFYRVKAAPNLTWGGVNATDALAIVRHYTNYVLMQGFRLQAADVNGSNNVNNTDALLITRRYSNLVPTFNVGAWLSENPIVQANGQTITQNIQTLCYGDVNGSYNPVQTRLAPKISFVELGTLSAPNNRFHLPIYSLDNQELGAISLAMVLPKGTRVLKVHSKIPEGIMEYGQWEDELRIGWFTQNQFAVKEGELLFEIELCMDGDTKEFGPSDIEVRGLSELANFWATPYDMARLGVPSVKIWNKSSEDLIIWPNPTNENARLRLKTSEPVLSCSLRVLDAVGREVYQANPSIVKIGDVQELVLPSAEWAKGIYAVQTNWTTLNGLNKSKTVMLRRE